MKPIIKILTLILITTTISYSWDYNEHKELGDAAFLKIIKKLIDSGYFKNQSEAPVFLENYFENRIA